MICTFNRWLIIGVIVIIASGIAATAWTAKIEDSYLREDLLTKSRLVEEGFSSDKVKALTGTDADLTSPDYLALKEEMIRVRSADPLIRFIYFMGLRPEGAVVFLIDSEPPGSPDYSPPGQVFAEVSPILLNSFISTQEESVVGPFSDRWGTWVSSITPVTDRRTGNVIAVFGMDVDADDWFVKIATAILPVVIVTFILLFILLVFGYMHQCNEQEKLILAQSEKAARESEKRLKQSEERLRLLLQNVNDGILVSRIQREGPGRILEVNDRACEILGYAKEELLQMSTSDLMVSEGPGKNSVLMEEFFSKGHTIFDTTGVRKDGQHIPVEISARLFEMEGEPAFLAAVRDISERKMLEREMEHHTLELTHYSNTLRQVNDKLNLMNRITRHDINNQLTALIGYLEIMKEEYPDPRLQQYIGIEIHAAQNIQSKIMFTKEYQDVGSQAPQWFDIGAVILSAAEGVPLAPITLTVLCHRIEIYADPLLERVFYTLLENAIRHGRTVTDIRFSCHEQEHGMMIVYEDDGEGVPDEHKEDIFQHKYFKHTGYGLLLSVSILSITGITIRETGVPGKGAKFEILVPKGAYRFTGKE